MVTTVKNDQDTIDFAGDYVVKRMYSNNIIMQARRYRC